MALSTPTTTQISDNLIAQISASIQRDIPLLPKSFTRVLAKALAGVYVLLYKYAGFILLQQFVQHASFEWTEVNGKRIRPLVEWGRLIGVGDPAEATAAELTVSFPVVNQDGSTLEANRQLVHPESGVIYLTLSSLVLDQPTKTVNVIAASDPDGNGGVGTLGNRKDGDVLKWANPIPQLSVEGAIVDATVTTAANGETEPEYRQRVYERFGARPQGGAYADYSAWGNEVTGVLNIYPYTGQPGHVDVYIEADEDTAIDGDGTPSQATMDAVKAAIEFDQGGLASRRPVGSLVTPWPITRSGFDVEITGLTTADEGTAKDTIEEALDDFLRSREPFITGISRLPRRDRVTLAGVSGIVDEAASSVGASVVSVKLKQGAGTLTEYSLDKGEKAKLAGPPTYI